MQPQSQGFSKQLMFTWHEETRDEKGDKNRINKNHKYTLTTSPEMIVGKKATIQETVNALHKRISKRMQKHLGRKTGKTQEQAS